MYPTQGVVMNIKLPGIVADDNEFVEAGVVVCASAEQGRFGGDAPVANRGDVERIEVRAPGA
jgi:hypothetical protein